jgi:aminoacyl tRNA synthase complex-interacting multifunctional protein 1
MSAIAQLSSPLKELVVGATQDGSADFGKNEKDKAEVSEWIEKVAAGKVGKPEGLKVSKSS